MLYELVTNVGIMAALVIIASEFLSRLTKLDGVWAQVQSWCVSVVLAAIVGYLGIGIFPIVSWFSTLVYGLLIGLVANGIFEIPITKTILEWLKARIKKS